MKTIIATIVVVALAILVLPQVVREHQESRSWVVLSTEHRGVRGGQGSGMTPIWCVKSDGTAGSPYTVWIPLSDKPDYRPGNLCPVEPEEAQRDRWDTAPLPPLTVLFVDDGTALCGFADTFVRSVPAPRGARVGDRCPG